MTRTLKEKLTFNLSKYSSVETFVDSDEMFWSDRTLFYSQESGSWYIRDSYHSNWYGIEMRYAYLSDLNYLIESEKEVTFWIVEDNEIIESLNAEEEN